MTKKITLSSLLICCLTTLFAQTTDTFNLDYELLKRASKWDGAVGGIFAFYDFEELNRALNAAGLPDINTNAIGVYVASRATSETSRWATESSLSMMNAYSNDGSTLNGRAVVYREFSGRGRLMYHLTSPKSLFTIYPFAATGINLHNLRTYTEVPSNGNFPAIINSDVRRYHFRSFSTPLEGGLGIELRIEGRRNDTYLGVRGGYSWNLFWNKWTLDGDISTDLPETPTTAPFVAAFIRFKPNADGIWASKKARMKN